jgi:hypothetical protein
LLDNISETEPVKEPSVEAVEKPPIEPTINNKPFLCNAKTSLADAHLNLMMMIISTDKAEQDALKREIDNASTQFEKAFATLHEIDNDEFTALQEIWIVYKNLRETKIIPAIMAGYNDQALEMANGIQAERMKAMKGIIQVDYCN